MMEIAQLGKTKKYEILAFFRRRFLRGTGGIYSSVGNSNCCLTCHFVTAWWTNVLPNLAKTTIGVSAPWIAS